MKRRIVISGLGLVAPNGIGRGAVWESVLSARSVTRRISKFDTAGFDSVLGGEIDQFDALQYMPARLARKLDQFSQYAVAAAQLAFRDGELDLGKVDSTRFGVYVGNCFGGWEFTDRELRKLHCEGVRAMSPFQAIAWFPAAPQGQISIHFGLRGNSKTFVCDRASGLAALGYAARAIALDYCDLVCAGGTEALMTPYAYLACTAERIVAGASELAPSQAYRPFDRQRRGLVPAEGAAFLLLEEREHALSRNAPIYAELIGFASATEPCHPAPLPRGTSGLSLAMRGALADAAITPDLVSLIMADAMATEEADLQESNAIAEVFAARAATPPVTAPKSMSGHLYGAAGAMDAALAALAFRNSIIPPTVNCVHRDERCRLDVVTASRAQSIEHVLINGRGSGGISVSLVLARAQPS